MKTAAKLTLNELIATPQFENWCHEAIQEVFESLFFVDAKMQGIEGKVEDVLKMQFEASGVVAFMTSEVEAIMQLACSRTTIYNLSTSLTGDPEYDEKNILCLGEAVNIIFGILKEKMNMYDLHYDKCLPLVIMGQNHVILNLNKDEAFNQIYKTTYGLFNLKIGFNHKKAYPKAS